MTQRKIIHVDCDCFYAAIEMRDALVALKGPLGNAPSFRKAIEGVLADDVSRARILSELDLLVAPATDV